MEKKLAMIVGNNFQEIEMVTTIDILRRAKIEVDIISFFNQELLNGAHGIVIKPDLTLNDFQQENYQGLIIPGGAGIDFLQDPLLEQTKLIEIVQSFAKDEKLIGAICAAPQVLGKAGLLKNKKITHFPTSTKFLDGSEIDLSKTSIIDGKIITGRSAGTAIDFALNIVEAVKGQATRDALVKQLVINY